MRVIDVAFLESLGSCERDVSIARSIWPEGSVQLDAATIRRALAAGLTVEWFARHVLPEDHLGEYLARRGAAIERFRSSRGSPPIQGAALTTARRVLRAEVEGAMTEALVRWSEAG